MTNKLESSEMDAIIQKKIHEGATMPELVEHCGISRAALYERCKRLGLKPVAAKTGRKPRPKRTVPVISIRFTHEEFAKLRAIEQEGNGNFSFTKTLKYRALELIKELS